MQKRYFASFDTERERRRGNDSRLLERLFRHRPELQSCTQWRWVHQPWCNLMEHRGVCNCLVRLVLRVGEEVQEFQ